LISIRHHFACCVAAALGVGFASASAQTPAAVRSATDDSDPIQFFNLLSKGKDFADRAELSGLQLSIFDRIAKRLGSRKSRITRAEFLAVHETRLAELSRARDGLTVAAPAGAQARGIHQPQLPTNEPQLGRTMPRLDDKGDAVKRPVVYRAGKLPNGLPAWFAQFDTDGDGQIGLYEWVKGGRPVEQFRQMDRNDDGFLTIDEVLHFLRPSVRQ
jgi:hypothetical protein